MMVNFRFEKNVERWDSFSKFVLVHFPSESRLLYFLLPCNNIMGLSKNIFFNQSVAKMHFSEHCFQLLED